jgi:hypothetical protein
MNMTAALPQEKQIPALKELIHNWINWLYTRSFYAPPQPENILAMLMEKNSKKSGEAPNGRNDPLCNAWNLVLEGAQKNALMGKDDDFVPFMYTYFEEVRPTDHNDKPLKLSVIADDILKVDRKTLYRRAHAGATRYYNLAITIQELSSQLHREVEAFTD